MQISRIASLILRGKFLWDDLLSLLRSLPVSRIANGMLSAAFILLCVGLPFWGLVGIGLPWWLVLWVLLSILVTCVLTEDSPPQVTLLAGLLAPAIVLLSPVVWIIGGIRPRFVCWRINRRLRRSRRVTT